jgi:hypothetical protein
MKRSTLMKIASSLRKHGYTALADTINPNHKVLCLRCYFSLPDNFSGTVNEAIALFNNYVQKGDTLKNKIGAGTKESIEEISNKEWNSYNEALKTNKKLGGNLWISQFTPNSEGGPWTIIASSNGLKLKRSVMNEILGILVAHNETTLANVLARVIK